MQERAKKKITRKKTRSQTKYEQENSREMNKNSKHTVAITINLTMYTTILIMVESSLETKRNVLANAQLTTLVKGLTFSHWGRAHTEHKHFILEIRFFVVVVIIAFPTSQLHYKYTGDEDTKRQRVRVIEIYTMKFTVMCKNCGVCKKMDESDRTIAVVLCSLLLGVGFFFLNVAVYQYVIKGKSTSSADNFNSKQSGRFFFLHQKK